VFQHSKVQKTSASGIIQSFATILLKFYLF
jgi:hypothetical protein